jgi:hypothetical protein
MERQSRETWAKRVERSGLTANEHAAEVGIKVHSLATSTLPILTRALLSMGTCVAGRFLRNIRWSIAFVLLAVACSDSTHQGDLGDAGVSASILRPTSVRAAAPQSTMRSPTRTFPLGPGAFSSPTPQRAAPTPWTSARSRARARAGGNRLRRDRHDARSGASRPCLGPNDLAVGLQVPDGFLSPRADGRLVASSKRGHVLMVGGSQLRLWACPALATARTLSSRLNAVGAALRADVVGR